MTRVLFVCLGNICRSPMAEGILRRKLRERGLLHRYTVDSAGTAAHHVGEAADPRTLEVLRRHEALCDLVARQVRPDDFGSFDAILAMDAANLRELERRCPPDRRGRLHLVLAPVGGGEVPDPYYGESGGFDRVHALLDAALDRWLERWEADQAS